MEKRLHNKQQDLILLLLPKSARIKIGLLIKTFQTGPSGAAIFLEKNRGERNTGARQIAQFVLNSISKDISASHSCRWSAVDLFPYPLQVQRQKQPPDMTSRGAGVWLSFYKTGLRSAAWWSHWRKHHRPPWEGKEQNTQLDSPSLYCKSTRETWGHNAMAIKKN